jgi:hypothetical protein
LSSEQDCDADDEPEEGDLCDADDEPEEVGLPPQQPQFNFPHSSKTRPPPGWNASNAHATRKINSQANWENARESMVNIITQSAHHRLAQQLRHHVVQAQMAQFEVDMAAKVHVCEHCFGATFHLAPSCLLCLTAMLCLVFTVITPPPSGGCGLKQAGRSKRCMLVGLDFCLIQELHVHFVCDACSIPFEVSPEEVGCFRGTPTMIEAMWTVSAIG